MKKRLSLVFVLCAMIFMAGNTKVCAQEENMMLTVGGTEINVEQLAEDNNVDPVELKQAIIDGMDAEKASPFSDLIQSTPNTEAYETVETGKARISNTVYKWNQDSTAYVANAGALTASGKTPAVGMCAMHTNVTTKTGSTSSTTVKLGTTIFMEDSVNVNGTNYSSFVVEDRGAPTNRTTYWIDIYFGLKSTYYDAAINYGVKTVSYHYSY